MAILVSTQDVATSGNVTAAFPTTYTPATGDFAVVILSGKAATLSVDNSPAGANGGGWTKRTGAFRTAGGPLQLATYYRVVQAGDTAPVFAVPTDWSGAAGGMTTQMLVITGGVIDTSTPFDVADQTNEGAADPFTPAGITTSTNGALVVSSVVTNDDNALALVVGSENGFTLQAGGAAYDVVTGGDQAIGIATKTQSTAGAVTPPDWDQTVNGVDGFLTLTFALKPTGGVTVVFDTGSLVLTGFAPTIDTGPITVVFGTGALTLTGFAPTVGLPVTVTFGTGALTLDGFAPTISVTTQAQGWVEFDVIVESTGTTFNFRWAQFASNGQPLTVKAGSYIEYTKIS